MEGELDYLSPFVTRQHSVYVLVRYRKIVLMHVHFICHRNAASQTADRERCVDIISSRQQDARAMYSDRLHARVGPAISPQM